MTLIFRITQIIKHSIAIHTDGAMLKYKIEITEELIANKYRHN